MNFNHPVRQLSIVQSIVLFALICTIQPAIAEPSYQFEKLWPQFNQPWMFEQPRDIEIDSNGLIYVANSLKNKIDVFNTNGVLVKSLNNHENNLRLHSVDHIAINRSGLVYALSSVDGIIYVFNQEGELIKEWCDSEIRFSNNTFDNPCITHNLETIKPFITVDNDDSVYLADNNGKIHIFNNQGEKISSWDLQQEKENCTPLGIDFIDSNNELIFVVVNCDNPDNQVIQMYELNGKLIHSWLEQRLVGYELSYIGGIDVGSDGLISVIYNNSPVIKVFNRQGHLIRILENKTDSLLEFFNSNAIAISKDNLIYSASNSDSIRLIDQTGSIINQWGGASLLPGHFNRPEELIAPGLNDWLYVVDSRNYRIQVFDSSENQIKSWSYFDEMYFPWMRDITISQDGLVYLSNFDLNTIDVFDLDGKFLFRWGGKGIGNGEFGRFISGLVIDSKGRIYVADQDNFRIQVFTSSGSFIRQWNVERTHSFDNLFPNYNLFITDDIEIDAQDNVYVLDNQFDSINVYNTNGELVRHWKADNRFKQLDENGKTMITDDIVQSVAMEIGPDGLVYVAMTHQSSAFIRIFTPQGEFLETVLLKNPIDNEPLDIFNFTLNSNKDIFISDTYRHRILKFSRSASLADDIEMGDLSGSWYDPKRSGEGLTTEVLDNKRAFVTWYTYDRQGQQRWISGVGDITEKSIILNEATITSGGVFGDQFDADDIEHSHWGKLRIHFQDCDHATVDFNGPAEFGFGTLFLQRLVSISGLECPHSLAKSTTHELKGISGSWYNPAHNGEGFVIHQYSNNQGIMYWYTYDNYGNQQWITGTGSIQDSKLVIENAISTKSGLFGLRFNSESVIRNPWGSIQFDFSNCDTASVTYHSSQGFGKGQMTLQRLTQPDGLTC